MIEVENFLPLLGKRIDSLEFSNITSPLGAPPILEDFDEGRSYASFPQSGIDIVLEDGVVTSIQFFAEGVEEDSMPYEGRLPGGITFNDSIASVREKMGAPTRSKDGLDDPRPTVRRDPWFKYESGSSYLHLTFSMAGDRVKIVTLGRVG